MERCKCGHRYSDHINHDGEYGACMISITYDYANMHIRSKSKGWNAICTCTKFEGVKE